MELGHDPRDAVYVARQPILLPSGRVYGYELLYRAAESDTSCTESGDVAGARVLTDTVLTLGLATLTNDLPAFFNLTPRLLLNGAATLLPPAAAVFELRSDIPIDAEIIDACRRLHGQGYSLALDGFTDESDADVLLPFVRFVKVDVAEMAPRARLDLAERLLRRGLRLIAQKVETATVAEQSRDAGFGLVQGFFFCSPATMSTAAVPAQRLAYLHLMAALNQPNLTMDTLEDLIKHDVSLCHRVLRCVNSAAMGVRGEIHSIRQAVMMLGLDQIRKWASVWSVAGLHSGRTPEIVTVALLRAHCCEVVGTAIAGPDAGSEYFLLGLCSLLDLMLHRPMTAVVADLPLSSDVREALLGRQNGVRAVLDAVSAYERGAFDEADAACAVAKIPTGTMPAAYAGALNWARALSSEPIAA
jgi:EAL and modified HD-GYP domain-containing signal transduction protein